MNSRLMTSVLKIERLQDGGFVVSDTMPYGCGESPNWLGPRFASTKIEEALQYIQNSLLCAATKSDEPAIPPGGVKMVKHP